MRISDWSSDVCSSDLGPSGISVHPAGCADADAVVRRLLLRGLSAVCVHLPLGADARDEDRLRTSAKGAHDVQESQSDPPWHGRPVDGDHAFRSRQRRSEEHTSELQSLMRISYAVFCLKKKKQITHTHKPTN